MRSTKFYVLVLCSCLICVASLCSAKDSKRDIIGYSTPDNTWHLNSKMDDIDLDGFADVPIELASASMFVDLARTIQFKGEDTLSSISLLELDDRLAGVLIIVNGSERSFGFFKDYFKDRYGRKGLQINESTCLGWVDEDNDSLTITYNINEDTSTYTSILYMNDALFDEITGYSIPDWMKELWETADTYDT